MGRVVMRRYASVRLQHSGRVAEGPNMKASIHRQRPQRRPHQRLRQSIAVAAGIAAISMLSACNKVDDSRTAGQKLDSAVVTVQKKGAELSEDVRKAGQEAAKAAGDATASVADKAKDAAITTAVNAKLVADPSLSALKIDVDTFNGHVTLRGTAVDKIARDRASELASEVDGVVAVDNRLTIDPKG